jgi:hypothetical protein
MTGRVESDLQNLMSAAGPGSASYRAAQADYVANVAQIQHYCAH